MPRKPDTPARKKIKKAIRERAPMGVQSDPRKKLWLQYYYDPESETFANAYRSGIKAGFKDSYARSLNTPSFETKWTNIENYMEQSNMHPQHIVKAFERLALRSPKEETQLKALEHLAKIKGMYVEKKLVGHVNIEELLQEDAEHQEDEDILDV